MAIWQDLVSDHGFAGSYQTVKRLIRKLRESDQQPAAGIILTGREKKRRSITAVAGGARSAEREVLPATSVRADFGLWPQIRTQRRWFSNMACFCCSIERSNREIHEVTDCRESHDATLRTA